MKEIMIKSSHGYLWAETRGGAVVRRQLDSPLNDHVASIKRFDLKEWRKHYPGEDMLDCVDILDLGYWYYQYSPFKSLTIYEPPCADWREEVKVLRKDNKQLK